MIGAKRNTHTHTQREREREAIITNAMVTLRAIEMLIHSLVFGVIQNISTTQGMSVYNHAQTMTMVLSEYTVVRQQLYLLMPVSL